MFNTIVTGFQKFFSAAFWIGNFLPFVIVTLVHLGIAALALPETVRLGEWITGINKDDSTGYGTRFAVGFIGLVLLAYIVGAFAPLLRRLLDGTLLPGWLYQRLRRSRAERQRAERGTIDAAMDRFAAVSDKLEDARKRCQAAFNAGSKLANAAPDDPFKAATVAVAALDAIVRGGGAAVLETIDAAVGSVEAVLESGSTLLAAPPAERQRGAAVHALYDRLLTLLDDAMEDALAHHAMLYARNPAAVLVKSPRATAIGDARAMTEMYSVNAYSVQFDYLWPRLLLVAREKDAEPFTERLTGARAQIDCAVLLLVLFLTVPLVWLPVAAAGLQAWLFLGIGLATPIAVAGLYQFVVRAQLAFEDVAKAAIDRFRLDLLTTVLRQPMPATLAVERELWTRMQQVDQIGVTVDVTYDSGRPKQ